jgi:mannosyl-glycoprotein endo-beta-N-acetylglucosaminidase
MQLQYKFDNLCFREFFLGCDGIFLNYNWTESRLSNSHKFASELSRDVKDIYVGLDVWGRGCPGGGGLNSSYVNIIAFIISSYHSKKLD